MAVIDIQKALGVKADGWYGDKTHKAFIKKKAELDFNWDYLRRKLGSFTQSQVDGLNTIMDAINKKQLKPQYAAYILATAWHETARKMQPIAEYGKGSTRRYGRWFKNSNGELYGVRNGNKKHPAYLHSNYPHLYYGRGHVQLTWLDNYIKAGEILGIDLANNPDDALIPHISADILVTGSMEGWFTGKSIPDYVTYGTYDEFVNARRVINGTDKADTIARYAKIFLTAIELKAY